MGEAKCRRTIIDQIQAPTEKDFEFYAELGRDLFNPKTFKSLDKIQTAAPSIAVDTLFCALYGNQSKDLSLLPDLIKYSLCLPEFLQSLTAVSYRAKGIKGLSSDLPPLDLLKAFCCRYVDIHAESIPLCMKQELGNWLSFNGTTTGEFGSNEFGLSGLELRPKPERLEFRRRLAKL